MTEPVISIIVPNFNKGRYIADTIKSVLAQSYTSWELVIVDDGSTDSSIEICEEYLRTDSRLKLIKRTGQKSGGSVCRNIGLKHAKGNYIIFLDSDDLLAPNCLEQRIKCITQNKKLNFVVFPVGTFFLKPGDNKMVWQVGVRENHLKQFLSHDLPWNIMSPIWKKEFLESLNGFNEEFPRLQDVELHTRALLQTNGKYDIVENSSIDCFYRIEPNRIISDFISFVERFLTGVILYVRCMTVEINSLKMVNQKLIKSLKGTVITAINQILFYEKNGDLDSENADRFIAELLKSDPVNGLLNSKDRRIIQFYIKGYKNNLYKIKGYNFALKQVLMF